MKYKITILIYVLTLWSFSGLRAQSPAKNVGSQGPYKMSLKEAVDFALANNLNVRNAQMDVQSAEEKVKETFGIGLPSVSAGAQLMHSPKVQPFVGEAAADGIGIFGPQPGVKKGQALPIYLALPNTAGATLQLNQLIFDGSYMVGLKASSTFKQLSVKQLQQSKIAVAENVTKAYYGVLVNNERIKILDINLMRLDSTIREMRAMQKAGFVEQLDVDRLEVSMNNLKTEKQKTQKLVDLSALLLKFQMGMAQNETLILTDKLEAYKPSSLSTSDNYSNRIEYSILQTQRDLAILDMKNKKAKYLPSLFASATMGSLTGASKFGNIPDFSNRWFNYSMIGFQLNVPIWDFSRDHAVRQTKLSAAKADNGLALLKQAIDLEQRQAITNAENANESLKVQQRNLDLAKEVLRVTKIKYKEGVGSNLEVVNAEASLREAQTNYYSALYDALIAQVDMQKATGSLLGGDSK